MVWQLDECRVHQSLGRQSRHMGPIVCAVAMAMLTRTNIEDEHEDEHGGVRDWPLCGGAHKARVGL